MNGSAGGGERTIGGLATLPGAQRRVAPHLVFFPLYNGLYFAPLLLVHIWGYTEGGAAELIAMDGTTMVIVTVIYAVGTLCFIGGSQLIKLIQERWLDPFAGRGEAPQWFEITLAERLAVLCAAAIFVASKAALAPLGVYGQYAFDTGQMTGGLWSFSMFASETLLLLAVLVLFSRLKHRFAWFTAISVLNGINVLHGSRIFFIISVLAGALYLYVTGRLTIRRMLIYGPLAAASVLVFAYVIFLSRSGVSLEGALSLAKLVSPLVYESLFSQLSLLNVLSSPDLVSPQGNAIDFIRDVALNTTPRFALAEKDELQFFSSLVDLSPLGAFNGYAAGLIYFGFFFGVFYFVLGTIARWLYSQAMRSQWWLIVYAYFTADFLFRIMRDGYLIPIKMLINTLQILLLLTVFRLLLKQVDWGANARDGRYARTTQGLSR